ncbi:hypothetical protein G3O06_07520 [Burkholderia sp. Ac-20345]|uniref:hypothetical protein n=1 Tax=Burkholderia sp. Ac-20345 TaxID=2703891 RepID=UPI00197C998F|nr:hypothetical protein [Burkholderia sp. Ac-20345]MBN3777399.1 hypothetical protein [Burkholderia sp. Ac-20345]
MKELPILFAHPMVRAILEGRKTQTRRVVKPQPEVSPQGNLMGEWLGRPLNGLLLPKLQDISIHCPYGTPGGRLWVRESYVAFGRWETRYSAKKGRDEWHFVDMTVETGRKYRFDGAVPNAARGGATPAWWRRPSIFMPRAAARTLLEVTSVRVERLQDISHDDAVAEGLLILPASGRYVVSQGDQYLGGADHDPRVVYADLWDSLNTERGHGWSTNPWVWVVEFGRIQQ